MSTTRVLFVTTNDIYDPIRGCDRRSAQLCGNLPAEWHVDSISYNKSDGPGRPESPPRTIENGERHVRLDYPDSGALAPFNPTVLSTLRSFGREYDLIVSSSVGSSVYGVAASYYTGGELIVDVHNVEDDLSLAIGDYQRFLFSRVFGRLALLRASLVAPTSETDMAQLPASVREKSVVVANGFDAEMFYRDDTEPDDRVLFFGNMSYEPNAEAVEVIADEIAPRLAETHPELEIHLAGPDCEEITEIVAGLDNVVVAGLVDDIASYIRESRVVIVPLLTGSGTRLKIIESLACGTPVVSTPKGAEGWPEDWPALRTVRVADFVEEIESVFDDGDELFDERVRTEIRSYSWESQVEKLATAINGELL
ncbi:glycosyltransferase family 4 protein [Salinirubrum litoreum]|uniref:Glycosyltransferase family 4 protein n=1 Tax=Salinirubrum litoreum TaxID=1126234 RepID=A0ABD5REY9_9EURY|nr:glycosyltransferase family 4 protein [Salinirubrum litoreum]